MKLGQISLVILLGMFTITIKPYYISPRFASLGVLLLGWKLSPIAFPVVLFLTFLVFLTPFEMMEGACQRMYFTDIYKHGVRSVFLGIITDTNLPLIIKFSLNYCISLLHILFPLAWTLTIKDVFARTFILALCFLTTVSIR